MTDLDEAIATYESLFGARLEQREELVEQNPAVIYTQEFDP